METFIGLNTDSFIEGELSLLFVEVELMETTILADWNDTGVLLSVASIRRSRINGNLLLYPVSPQT